jgi:hypothetical protein
MFLQSLAAALADVSVPYCIVGGVAVNLHGVPRMTYDVDIIVATGLSAYERAHATLTALGLLPRHGLSLTEVADESVRRRLKNERHLLAVTYSDPNDAMREVDILVDPDLDADGLVARAILRPKGRVTLRVACRQDLVAMKRSSGRPRDISDVRALERGGE